MNCQLASTNVFLGGQMQWDLIVSSLDSTSLCVKDFHLSPISEYIDFQYNQDSDLLNYKHLENVKRLYERLKGNFFKNSYNPKLSTLYPTHFNDYDYPYENTYHCGVKRMKYQRYGTQFHAFCPLWIEDFDVDTQDINIYIRLYTLIEQTKKDGTTIQTKKTISSKKLCLTKCEGNRNYHTKFSEYLKDYLKLIETNDNVCSIDFLTKESWVRGVNVEKGVTETKDTSYLVNNILERERPLLEFNSMLTNQFSANKIIARQLFNFNVCFNIYDIVPIMLLKPIMDNLTTLNIEVTAEINDKESQVVNTLDFKDFFTNHEYINRLQLGGYRTKEKINCLDYLQDNKCIDFIDKNKISPQICHWSLLDDSEYVFQLYDGFAPVYVNSDGSIIKNSHKYYNMPDVWSTINTNYNNSYGWCNVIWNSIENIDSTILEGKFNDLIDYTEFKFGQIFYANSLKYNTTSLSYIKNNPNDVDITSIYVNIIVDDGNKLSNIKTQTNWYKIDETIYCHLQDNCYLTFVVFDTEKSFKFLNYKNFIQKDFHYIFGDIDQDLENISSNLQNILKTLEKPKIVLFNKGLNIKSANRPDVETGSNSDVEIEYTKKDNINQYLIRYDGKIRPCMISYNSKLYNNYLYYKLSDKPKELDVYNKYIPTKFPPLYPSLNYFAIKKIEKIDFNKPSPSLLPHINDDSFTDNDKLNNLEYSWYNYSQVYSLKTNITFNIEDNIKDEEELITKIKKQLGKIYNISNVIIIEYIYKQYEVLYDWEYTDFIKNNTNSNFDYKYIYTIKLNLK